MEPGTLILAVIVAFAFAVETALGFGATLIAVSLGSGILPITELLPAFVPLNLLLSLTIVLRHRREIDKRLLLLEVLPLMGLGLPLGLWAFTSVDEGLLKRVLGGFVFVLAARELRLTWRARTQPAGSAQQPSVIERVALFLGGAAHGAFGTGGPLAVYALGRRGLEKAAFRVTLSALWLVLNLALLSTYLWAGRLTTATLRIMPPLAAGGLLGLLGGAWAFQRVPPGVFRVAVWLMLLLVGAVLALD